MVAVAALAMAVMVAVSVLVALVVDRGAGCATCTRSPQACAGSNSGRNTRSRRPCHSFCRRESSCSRSVPGQDRGRMLRSVRPAA